MWYCSAGNRQPVVRLAPMIPCGGQAGDGAKSPTEGTTAPRWIVLSHASRMGPQDKRPYLGADFTCARHDLLKAYRMAGSECKAAWIRWFGRARFQSLRLGTCMIHDTAGVTCLCIPGIRVRLKA